MTIKKEEDHAALTVSPSLLREGKVEDITKELTIGVAVLLIGRISGEPKNDGNRPRFQADAVPEAAPCVLRSDGKG